MCELTWLICCGCTHDVLCHLQQSHRVSYGKLILTPSLYTCSPISHNASCLTGSSCTQYAARWLFFLNSCWSFGTSSSPTSCSECTSPRGRGPALWQNCYCMWQWMVPLSGCFCIGHFIGQTPTVNKDLCGSNNCWHSFYTIVDTSYSEDMCLLIM